MSTLENWEAYEPDYGSGESGPRAKFDAKAGWEDFKVLRQSLTDLRF